MLTCPVCGCSDSSQPVPQVWENGRNFVPRPTGESREWTEEVLTPLARRVKPPVEPNRGWLLWLAGGVVVFTICCSATGIFGSVGRALLLGFVAAPALLVFYVVERIRNDAKLHRAHEVWRQTWYCHRCDCVWLPGSDRRAVPSYALRRMVWRAA